MLSCPRHKWLLIGINRRVVVVVIQDGRLVACNSAHRAAVGVVIVVMVRRVAHLGDWVVHLLSRRASISWRHLLVRIPVNVVISLMMISVRWVAEGIYNVLLVTRSIVVAAGVVRVVCHELGGLAPLLLSLSVVAWRLLLASDAAALHLLWHHYCPRGSSCLVAHAAVPTESGRLVNLLLDHVVVGQVWILGDCSGRFDTILVYRCRTGSTFDQIVLIYVVSGRLLLACRLGAAARVALAVDDLGGVATLGIRRARDSTLRAPCGSPYPTGLATASDLLDWAIQIGASSVHYHVINVFDVASGDALVVHLLVLLLRCLVDHGVLRVLGQLFLRVRVADRMVVSRWLVDFLYLPCIVFNVLENLVRILGFWIFLVLLAYRAWRRSSHLTLDGVVGSSRIADSRLLTGALLVDGGTGDAGDTSSPSCLMCPLNCSKQFCIDRLDRGSIDSLNRTLHLRLVDLFEHVEWRICNLSANCSLAAGGFSRRLRTGVRSCLLGCGRLLVDTIFREAVVQVGALFRVIDDFEALLDFGTLQYLAFATLASPGV